MTIGGAVVKGSRDANGDSRPYCIPESKIFDPALEHAIVTLAGDDIDVPFVVVDQGAAKRREIAGR
jgi:hypothetical protein